MPTKEKVTEEILYGVYSFVGKIVKHFYNTRDIYVGLYLYVLIVELSMIRVAFDRQRPANWTYVAAKFENKDDLHKMYELRNRLSHNPYDFSDWNNLLSNFKDLNQEHIEVVERLAFNCNPGIIRDIMKCVEQESLKDE